MPHRASTSSPFIVAAALLSAVVTACSTPQVAPVPDGPPPTIPAPTRATPSTTATSDVPPASVPPSDPAPTTTPGIPTPTDPATIGVSDADRALVQDLLDRYDRVLTDISAAPESVEDPSDPLRSAWHAVVPADSELSESVLGRIRDRRADGVVVEPVAPGGLSYVHHAREVVRAEPPADPTGTLGAREELAFTWCGWSPGLGRRIVGRNGGPGPVVDDTVAHGLGTGRVVRDAPGEPWVLASLIESDLTLLPPGSPDPCI